MVTSDEIAQVPLFAVALGGRPRAALAGRPPTSASPRASTRCTRARSARCSPCSRAGSRSSSSSTGSSACSASALPGAIFGEVPITLGTHVPERLPRGGALARHADRGAAVLRARRGGARGRAGGRRAGARAHRRPAGRRRRAAAAARVSCSGTAGTRPAPSCAAFSTATRSRSSGSTPDATDAAERWGGDLPADGDLPGPPRARRDDARAAAAARGRRAARPADARVRRRVRHGRHRRRAGRARRRRLRRVRGPAHDRDRAGGARAARPGRRRGSRTTSASRPASRATSSASARCSRRAASARRSSSRARSRASTRHARASTSTAATSCAARTIILATGVTWRHLAIDGHRAADRQGHLLRRGAQRGGEHARARRPHHRRGQLGRAGGALLRQPRAHGHDRLPRRRAREEHVAVPRRPGPPEVEHRRSQLGAEVAAVHGDAKLEAIDISERAHRRDDARTSAAASSSSSAPTRTRPGCRRRSRSTSAATC